MTSLQRYAWSCFALFLTVVVITHFPGLTDADGRNLGLFVIDPIDDLVHALSGVLAAFAAWHTARVSQWYFRLFGALYGLDAIVGFAIFASREPFAVAFAANAPHVAIAAFALWAGFRLSLDRA